MALYNKNSGWGLLQMLGHIIERRTTGRVFMVALATEANYNTLADLYKPDPDGVLRLYTTITLALAACTAGRGDSILLSPGFTTAPTLAELATCATKGVLIEQAGGKLGEAFVTLKATAALPYAGVSSLFTVTAPVKLLDIYGEVTTAIQSQLTSVVLSAVPTVGASVNIAGAVGVNLNAAAVGTVIGITGTLATAPAANTDGVFVAQAAPLVIPAGTIQLYTPAGSTGSIKWVCRYQPLVPGARVFAA